jgi:transposase
MISKLKQRSTSHAGQDLTSYQAVSLVLHSGRTIRDVAKSIGVHEITLGKWVNKARGGDSGRDKVAIQLV